MSQPESRLQRRIRKAVQREFGGYWWKVHGGPFTPAGIPDLAGVVNGHSVFLEVKRPGEDASLVQQKRMRDLERAGAIVGVVHSVDEALMLLQHALPPRFGDPRLPSRFWEKVRLGSEASPILGPCWIWTAHLTPLGYAHFRHTRRDGSSSMNAPHRWVWEQLTGRIIPEGLEMDHLCRVRSCQNPTHLQPVTHVVNVRRGKATKLTWPQICEIRRLRKEGLTLKEVGRRFGITHVMVSKIYRQVSWV